MFGKTSLKSAGIIAVSMNSIAILVHILVILQVIPFTWISGGKVDSLVVAQQTSIVSSIILAVTILFHLVASGIIPLKFNKFFNILISIGLWINVLFFSLSFVLQLLGTIFEKTCMSVVVFILVLSIIRLAIEKRQIKWNLEN